MASSSHPATPAPPPLRETDPTSVAAYVLSFDWPMRDAAAERGLVAGGLPLWLEILRLIPQPAERGRLLELGSPPFHMTLLAQKFRNYEVTMTAGTADTRKRFRQEMSSSLHGEGYVFDCECFDLERDEFPYPDAHFDTVLFCEVIEHLTENPVFTLREIHRVLKPGGSLVISTPNAARSGNLMRLWLGVNVFDQYHLGAPLRGTRHSREYVMRELRLLLSECGFHLDRSYGRNLGQVQFVPATRPLEYVFRLFTLLAPAVHSDHLFVRATKSGNFRWAFPRELFDQGHLVWYVHPCDSEAEMGHNDVPHTGRGWGPLESGPDGRVRRRVGPTAVAYLRSRAPSHTVVVEAAGAGTASVLQVEAFDGRGDDARCVGTARESLQPGVWTQVEAQLEGDIAVRQEITLRLTASGAAYVRRFLLA